MQFTDEVIVKLFGHEEAEREEPERLIEYFVKNDVYERVRANLRLRILVGYKGVGKSALLKVCEIEDARKEITSVWIKPDDIERAKVKESEADLSAQIREWKNALQDIIFRKVAETFGQIPEESENQLKVYGSGFLQSLISLANKRMAGTLEPAKRAAVKGFTSKRTLVVYIDDLDRDWNGSRAHILRISALLNAVRDMIVDTKGINFKIALRSDVYYVWSRNDSSSDKVVGDTIWMQWTNDDIFRVLIKRVATYSGKGMQLAAFGTLSQPQLANYLDGVFESKYQGKGLWEDRPMYHVILSFVRAKPRDIVLFCSGAARLAGKKHEVIHSGDVTASLRGYCTGCVKDLINEFRSELPTVDRLISGMRTSQRELKMGKGSKYTTDELVKKLKDLISQGKFVFFNGSVATPNDLIRFMFKINFITARRQLSTGFIDRRYFDQAMYLTDQYVQEGYEWEIHPAYRWSEQLAPADPSILMEAVALTDLNSPT